MSKYSDARKACDDPSLLSCFTGKRIDMELSPTPGEGVNQCAHWLTDEVL